MWLGKLHLPQPHIFIKSEPVSLVKKDVLRYTVKETADSSIRDFNTLNKQSDYVQDNFFGVLFYKRSHRIF